MSAVSAERVDVAAIRAAHPIEDVIASSGVELHASGHGYMGCCPFHDDSTASMSVGGVPDRFRCFGCDAGGDVIEYVSRRYHLSFIDSIKALRNDTIGRSTHGLLPSPRTTSERDLPPISAERAYDINRMAWEHFATPVATEFAQSYLARRRGIDLGALRGYSGGAPVVGYAGTGWTRLVSHLHDKGVSDDELRGHRPGPAHPKRSPRGYLPRADHHPRHQQRRPDQRFRRSRRDRRQPSAQVPKPHSHSNIQQVDDPVPTNPSSVGDRRECRDRRRRPRRAGHRRRSRTTRRDGICQVK